MPNALLNKVHFCERDSSGTTEAANGGEGDGADSPTARHEVARRLAQNINVLISNANNRLNFIRFFKFLLVAAG